MIRVECERTIPSSVATFTLKNIIVEHNKSFHQMKSIDFITNNKCKKTNKIDIQSI